MSNMIVTVNGKQVHGWKRIVVGSYGLIIGMSIVLAVVLAMTMPVWLPIALLMKL